MSAEKPEAPEAVLVVKRSIAASAAELFDAWTTPAALKAWWGPPGVRCVDAEIDLRVGGRYRIANELPDRSLLWISGEFELISRPTALVYSWEVSPNSRGKERVSVSFKEESVSGRKRTEVTIVHERIGSRSTRDEHERGWHGCLEGL